jgi:hypothetical protein
MSVGENFSGFLHDEEFPETLQRGVGHSPAGLFSQKRFNGLSHGDASCPRFIKF